MRTKEEIKAEMDAELALHPELLDLNNSESSVSLWQLLKNMWVTFVQLLETRWDNLVAETDQKIGKSRTGTTSWYVVQAKAFQLGDSLDLIDGVAGYAVIDAAKCIITQATASEDMSTGRITLRLAKSSSPTSLVELTTGEINAAREYIQQKKYAGVPIDIVSIPADEIKIVARVKVDPQRITTLGTDVANPDKYVVLDGVAAYLRSLPDNSEISWTGLTDYMQSISGVRDFVISESAIRRPGTATWTAVSSVTLSAAGHGVLHADSQFTYVS